MPFGTPGRSWFFQPCRRTRSQRWTAFYLGGGYPEVYAQALFRQAGIRSAIRAALRDGMPTVAECGGFLYLQEQLQTEQRFLGPWWRRCPAWVILPVSCGGLGISPSKRARTAAVSRGEEIPAMNFTIGTAPKLERHFWLKTIGKALAVRICHRHPLCGLSPISILGRASFGGTLCQRQRPIGKGNRDDLEGDLEKIQAGEETASAGAPALGQSGQALGELGHFGRAIVRIAALTGTAEGLFEESGTGGAVRGQWSGQPGVSQS